MALSDLPTLVAPLFVPGQVHARPHTAACTQGPAHDGLARLLSLVAQGSLPVTLIGETGVGKGVWARRLHDQSPRSSAPFVTLRCAAIPEPLLESALFGHGQGGCAGVGQPRVGLLESAGSGTVFLDELSELPLGLQARLLPVLENQQVFPPGASGPRPVLARFVSATHRNLESLVASGEFRADLFFRLTGVTLRIPPLRERTSEIASLARSFCCEAAKSLDRPEPAISAAALAWLQAQPWPGNVRELKHRIECACLLCGDGPIEVCDLAPEPGADGYLAAPAAPSLWGEFNTIERQRILAALASCNGNQTRAAARLGISRRTLINRLDDYGVARPRKKR